MAKVGKVVWRRWAEWRITTSIVDGGWAGRRRKWKFMMTFLGGRIRKRGKFSVSKVERKEKYKNHQMCRKVCFSDILQNEFIYSQCCGVLSLLTGSRAASKSTIKGIKMRFFVLFQKAKKKRRWNLGLVEDRKSQSNVWSGSSNNSTRWEQKKVGGKRWSTVVER